MRPWQRSWMIVVSIVFGVVVQQSGPSTAQNASHAVTAAAEVVTLAGDGRSGITDGTAANARFSLPSGLAKAADGTIYVADEAAQRIKAVKPDGTVRTVAGSGDLSPRGLSVVGGYQDGPALSARFNHPAGLAVDAKGSVFIADSANGCIRQLANGIVSTAVGKAGKPGAQDGAPGDATLTNPRALAFDSRGNLYIADYGIGLRRADANKTLSTIRFKSNGDIHALSVSVTGSGENEVVFVTTPDVLFVYHPASGLDEAYYAPNGSEGGAPFGQPNQIAAIDARQLLMTDQRAHNIRYIRLPAMPFVTAIFSRIVAGGSSERPKDNTGFANGDRASARFTLPQGIVLDGRSAVVADGGNRRIRRITLPNIRVSEAGPVAREAYDAGHYQIAYIGQSSAFWDTLGDDGFCAVLESSVNASGQIKKPARCHTIRMDSADLHAMREYIDGFLSYQHVDLVVLAMNGNVASSASPKSSDWNAIGAALRTEMTGLIAQLPEHARLALCWTYYAADVSASDGLVSRTVAAQVKFPDEPGSNDPTTMRNTLIKAMAPLPVLQYDSYDDFLRLEQGRNPPLYGYDGHMTALGSAVLANGVSSVLVSHARQAR